MSRPSTLAIRTIDDLAMLRPLTQPVRLKIVETLRVAPELMTVHERAFAFGATQIALTYHVNSLEPAHLLRVAESRTVSSVLDKRYATATHWLTVDRALLPAATAGQDGIDGHGSTDILLGRNRQMLTVEPCTEDHARLDILLRELQEQDTMPEEYLAEAPPGGQIRKLLHGLLPVVVNPVLPADDGAGVSDRSQCADSPNYYHG